VTGGVVVAASVVAGCELGAVIAWPGPRLVITHESAGMADLAALAAVSEGAIVAVDGITAVIVGPQRLDALRPAQLGHDITRAVMLVGPVVGAGAVATW
jgi:hypothetical protein